MAKGAAKIKALVEEHKVDVTIDGGRALIAPTQLAGCNVADARTAIEEICRRALKARTKPVRAPRAEPLVVASGEAHGSATGVSGSVVKGKHRDDST